MNLDKDMDHVLGVYARLMMIRILDQQVSAVCGESSLASKTDPLAYLALCLVTNRRTRPSYVIVVSYLEHVRNSRMRFRPVYEFD